MIASSSPKRRLAGLAVTGLAALLVTAIADPAAARSTREREPKRDDSVLSRPAGVPLLAVVSLSEQRVTIYDAEGSILRAPVSTGQTGYETPAGIYSVIQKEAEHYSNLYDDASMPFMQRITWSGIALHAGVLPGHPASHGCIRLPLPVRRAAVRADSDGHARDRGARRHDARPTSRIRPCSSRGRSAPRCRLPPRQPAVRARSSRCGWAPARRQRAAAHHSAAAPQTLKSIAAAKAAEAEAAAEGRGRGQVGRRQDWRRKSARLAKAQRLAEGAKTAGRGAAEGCRGRCSRPPTPRQSQPGRDRAGRGGQGQGAGQG